MNIKRIFKILLNKWYVLAIFVLLCLVIALCGNYFLSADYYYSEGKIFISSVVDEEKKVDITSSIIDNIMDIAKSDAVLNEVVNDPKLQVLGYSAIELNDSIVISRTTSGIIITCKTVNAMHSQIIVQAYLNSGVPKIQAIIADNSMKTFKYTIVGEPSEGEKSKSAMFGSLLIGVVAGIILGSIAVAIPYWAGRKPNVAEYLAEDYECKVLGVLPKESLK